MVSCADNGITMEMVSLDPGVTIGPTWIAGGVANDIPLSLFLLMPILSTTESLGRLFTKVEFTQHTLQLLIY